jgi:hypothetical protein
MDPSQIPVEGLTHLNLAFGFIQPGNVLVSLPPDTDIYKMKERLTSYQCPNWIKKCLLSYLL